SFAEIKERVGSFPDPKKLIVKRILQELQEPQKRYLFVRPYVEKHHFGMKRNFRRR
ncbi:MAG: DUF655 domain-containing protein, partial [Candidatus Nanohaloarchaeota archaeon]|nr:DUF655 domain-containing protein [Candidatus Nanohaloarchaeota archaeon]